MKPFRILSREIVLDSPYCPIEKQLVELPDGTTAEWFINRSRDAVIVLPILKNGKFVYQKNYKHGSGKIVQEFPAGIIDKGETPEIAAARELEEETGLVAQRLEFLGSVYANPTGASMKYYFYVALGCDFSGIQQLEPAEQIELLFAESFSEVSQILCSQEENTSSATMSALGLYAQKRLTAE